MTDSNHPVCDTAALEQSVRQETEQPVAEPVLHQPPEAGCAEGTAEDGAETIRPREAEVLHATETSQIVGAAACPGGDLPPEIESPDAAAEAQTPEAEPVEEKGEEEAVEGPTSGRTNYRETLVKNAQDAIDAYDKALMTLSAGALSISFAFIKDIVKPERMVETGFLLTAWGCWVFTLSMVVLSFYSSHLAHRLAVKQFDAGNPESKGFGGRLDFITRKLNFLTGLSFVAGLVIMGVFINKNISYAKSAQPKTIDSTTATDAPARASAPGAIASENNPK